VEGGLVAESGVFGDQALLWGGQSHGGSIPTVATWK